MFSLFAGLFFCCQDGREPNPNRHESREPAPPEPFCEQGPL